MQRRAGHLAANAHLCLVQKCDAVPTGDLTNVLQILLELALGRTVEPLGQDRPGMLSHPESLTSSSCNTSVSPLSS